MRPPLHIRAARRARQGLTLIEMLLVVLILSAVAMLALASFEQGHDQLRFEDTRARIEQVRQGVLGGEGGPRGFVNDVGRLPEGVAELLEPGALPPWSFDRRLGLWSGWRGPYVPVRARASGLATYQDGWELPFQPGDPDHGWKLFKRLPPGGQALYVQSYGSDGLAGGTAYAADFPPDLPPSAQPLPLVAAADHLLDLRGARIELTLVNDTDTALAGLVLRVRCWYPRDGTYAWPSAWPATSQLRDAEPWLSEEVRADVPARGSAQVTVRFLAPDLPLAHPKEVPAGLRAFSPVDDATGAPIGAPRPAQVQEVSARGSAPSFALLWQVAP